MASETGYVLYVRVQYVGDTRCNSSASRFGLERGTVRVQAADWTWPGLPTDAHSGRSVRGKVDTNPPKGESTTLAAVVRLARLLGQSGQERGSIDALRPHRSGDLPAPLCVCPLGIHATYCTVGRPGARPVFQICEEATVGR